MTEEYVLKETQVGPFTIKITHDTEAPSPREDDNLGTFLTWTYRYRSPDANPFTVEEFKSKILNNRDWIVLPVYKYEHGGIAYSTESFENKVGYWHARFDSGQCGWICVGKHKVRQWFGLKKVTKDVVERVKRALAGEVEEYSSWANGSVYQYEIYPTDDPDNVVEYSGNWYNLEDCFNDAVELAEWKIGKGD